MPDERDVPPPIRNTRTWNLELANPEHVRREETDAQGAEDENHFRRRKLPRVARALDRMITMPKSDQKRVRRLLPYW
jgi:hypothetical protein